MKKKLLPIVIPLAAILTTALILLLTGTFSRASRQSGESPDEAGNQYIKDDYLPDEILPQTEDSPSADNPDTPPEIIREDPEFSEEPVPAEKLLKDDLQKWNLILVGPDYPLSPDFTVDLTEVSGGYLVDVRIADALEAMIADAASENIRLTVCSAFRTLKVQRTLIERKAQELVASGLDSDLAYSAANRYIAEPGESEHHTGLAVDFLTDGVSRLDERFASTKAYSWLTENAHRYGFILRYPKGKEDITHFAFEPWHYRYVGREYAAAIKDSGLCLEEYLSKAE